MRMKHFKFLTVSYRISLIILLALCAEHSSACNWFKFNSKPSGHNIIHNLIKSSNQGTHKKAGTNDQITPYIESQQESSKQDAEKKENAWKLLFEALGKMSKNHNPVKSHVGSHVQESSNDAAAIKDIAWKLVFETLDKMTKTNNRNAETKENAGKLMRETLDKMAKTYSLVTNYIHWKNGSGNQDSTIKEIAWKLISEALEKMFKTNIRVIPHNAATVSKTKRVFNCNCKYNDAINKSYWQSAMDAIKGVTQYAKGTSFNTNPKSKCNCK